MAHYRAYFIGQDGHFFQAIDLDSADDDAAIATSKQFVDGHDVELWQRDRKIARLDSKPD